VAEVDSLFHPNIHIVDDTFSYNACNCSSNTMELMNSKLNSQPPFFIEKGGFLQAGNEKFPD